VVVAMIGLPSDELGQFSDDQMPTLRAMAVSKKL
jgi:hypothetical protein